MRLIPRVCHRSLHRRVKDAQVYLPSIPLVLSLKPRLGRDMVETRPPPNEWTCSICIDEIKSRVHLAHAPVAGSIASGEVQARPLCLRWHSRGRLVLTDFPCIGHRCLHCRVEGAQVDLPSSLKTAIARANSCVPVLLLLERCSCRPSPLAPQSPAWTPRTRWPQQG